MKATASTHRALPLQRRTEGKTIPRIFGSSELYISYSKLYDSMCSAPIPLHTMSSYFATEDDYKKDSIAWWTYSGSIRYRSCTTTELMAFIIARGGHIPGPNEMAQGLDYSRAPEVALHGYFRQILARLDSEATFRFLDLPAEMRNMVYAELLTYDNDNDVQPKRGSTGLLQASKQTYKEAKGVQWAQSVASVWIWPCMTIASWDYVDWESYIPSAGCEVLYNTEQLKHVDRCRTVNLHFVSGHRSRSWRRQKDEDDVPIAKLVDLLVQNLHSATRLRVTVEPKWCPSGSQATRMIALRKLLSDLVRLPSLASLQMDGLNDLEHKEVWLPIETTRKQRLDEEKMEDGRLFGALKWRVPEMQCCVA